MNAGPFDSTDPARRLAPVPDEGDPAYYGTPMNLPGGQPWLTDAEATALAGEATGQPDHDDDAEGGTGSGEENIPRDAAGPPGGGDETNIPRT